MKSKVLENKRNKETALLNSAFDLFTKKDIHSVTVQDIVKKANVAKGTFYLYFKDKYQIRDVLIQKEAAHLFQEAREKLEQNDIQNFEDAIIFIINQVLLSLEDNPAILTNETYPGASFMNNCRQPWIMKKSVCFNNLLY